MIFGFAVNLLLWLQSIKLLPNPLAGVYFPAVAFTWYSLIGAIVTFAVGTVASLLLPGDRARRGQAKTAARVASIVIALIVPFLPPSRAQAEEPAVSHHFQTASEDQDDFNPITTLVNQAIAAKKLPGAVVLVNHDGK